MNAITRIALLLFTVAISAGCAVDRAGIADPNDPRYIDGSIPNDDCGCEDDGNPCTNEACTPDGRCQYLPNEDPCDDDDFCNGADTCSMGTCSAHDGNPCGGNTLCDAERQQCVGCLRDRDCPRRRCEPYGDCEYDSENVCDDEGFRERSCERFECQSGACVAVHDGIDTKDCHRNTENWDCGEERACTPCTCNGYGYCSRRCRDQEFECDEGMCVLDEEDSDEIEDCDPF